jgi:hypothetical protein
MKPREFLAKYAEGHSLGSLMTQAHKLGAKNHKPAYYNPEKLWTVQETCDLRKNYATMPTAKLRKTLLPNRSLGAIYRRAKVLGLRQPNANHRTRGEAETTECIFQHCTEIDKAYLAGIIDGEGSLGYYWKRTKLHRQHRTMVTITNCDNNLMAWIKAKFGHVQSAFQSRKKGRSMRHVCHNWEVWGNQRIRHFLVGILPYLIVKREQAELLLGLYPETVAERKALARKIKNAKTSGFTKNSLYEPIQV